MPFPEDYMNFAEYRSIIYSKKLFRQTTTNLLKDKISFALLCEQKSLEVPRMISYNIFNSFYNGKKATIINTPKAFQSYLKQVFKDSRTDRIFVKASESKGGKGVYVVTLNTGNQELHTIWESIQKGAFVFQEALEQHDSINQIYPYSINTIRVETFLNATGEVEILGGYMRFGAGNSYVDNVSSGGFFVPLDFQTGRLQKHGYTALIYGSDLITHHPTTGFPISNYEIPYFFEAVDLCKKFAGYIPNRIIGWDVAITPHGPLIIEGNHDPAIIAGEYSYNGFKKHPVFKEILGSI